MFGKKVLKPRSQIDSLIGSGMHIEGNVSFSGGLRVDGEIKGNVRAESGQPAMLVLSEQARIEGVIEVSHLLLNGTVVGPVHVSEYAELQPKSRVTGNIFYKMLEMHVGAIVEGNLVHQDQLALPSPDSSTIRDRLVVD